MPKGVSIPPRFAAIFCIIKMGAINFSLPVAESERYPRGKKVKSAMSLARNIEPIKVIYTSAKASVRVLPVSVTIFLAVIVKKRMFFNAQITASVQKRQVNVLKSKYSRYFASGFTIKQDRKAKVAAITKTMFVDAKSINFLLRFNNNSYIDELNLLCF